MPTTESPTLVKETDEAQLKWRTLEDSLNLAVTLSISSKSPADALLSQRLALRLVWLLIHSDYPMPDAERYQLRQLSRDLTQHLSHSPNLHLVPNLRRDLERYRFREDG